MCTSMTPSDLSLSTTRLKSISTRKILNIVLIAVERWSKRIKSVLQRNMARVKSHIWGNKVVLEKD